MPTVKQLVAPGNRVSFTKYFDGQLWYRVLEPCCCATEFTSTGFEFPVPIADIGNATFLAEDKALLFMWYIRKHLEMLEIAKADEAGNG